MQTVDTAITVRERSPPRSEVLLKVIQPGPKYSEGVRIGNWVEDLIECPKEGTLYFPPKETTDKKMKPETRQHDFRQNKLKGSQGFGVYTVVQHDSHLECPNYITTNDVVYKHQPQPLCGPPMRYYKVSEHQWYPQPDMTKCTGYPITEFGLRTYKKYEWACTDVSDYASTLYEDTYVAPTLNQYLKAADRKARDSTFTKGFRFKMTKPITRKPKKK